MIAFNKRLYLVTQRDLEMTYGRCSVDWKRHHYNFSIFALTYNGNLLSVLAILWLSLIEGQCRVKFSATLRLRGRLGRNSCQSAMWDCFGTPKTVPQCALTTILIRSPAQPQSDELHYGTFLCRNFAPFLSETFR